MPPAEVRPPNRRVTLTWTKAGVFFLLGLWPAVLILYNLRPILTLAQQLHRYQEDLDFAGASDRFSYLAGANLPAIVAVNDAVRALNETRWNPDEFARLRAAAPGNAVPLYLEAAARLAALSARAAGGVAAEAAPPARFEAVRPTLQEAHAAGTCDWLTAATMNIWVSALAESGARDDLRARLARDWAGRGKARALRSACGGLLKLADELAAASHFDQARVCVAAAADFAARSLDGAVSADFALACARQVERAYRRESLLEAAAQRWAEARRADAHADQARRFREILQRRRVRAPHDPMLNTPVTREQPYRAVVCYLLASGVLVSGWATVLAVALVALVVAAVAHRFGVSTREQVTVGPGLVHWLWVGGLVAGPPVGLAAVVLLVPLDLASVMSLTWVQSVIVLAIILTLGSVLTVSRGRASAGRTPPGSSRVWQWWWAAVALVGLLVLFRPWSPFGADPARFEQSLGAPQAPTRAYGVQFLALGLGAVAAVVWLAWCLASWLKGRKKASPQPEDAGRPGMGRAALVLAMWSWLILGIMSLGAVRLYHRYDSRRQQLSVHDLRDEVTAWMGPTWKPTFFPALE